MPTLCTKHTSFEMPDWLMESLFREDLVWFHAECGEWHLTPKGVAEKLEQRIIEAFKDD